MKQNFFHLERSNRLPSATVQKSWSQSRNDALSRKMKNGAAPIEGKRKRIITKEEAERKKAKEK
ncbi:hypothetical protein SESBI_29173 [Sesbania bispinosa]|nr:hypothetical protein SESBI_29173 [Sesbania bispinosa]